MTKGRKLRLDATCVQTTIHHPTDSGLLVDSVRVLSRLVQRAKPLVAEQLQNVQAACRSRLRSARQAAQRLHRLLRRKSEEKVEQQRAHYQKLIETAEQMVRICQHSEENLAWRPPVGYACGKQTLDEGSSMNCPHCASSATKAQRKKTPLGYRTFRCSVCTRLFNERTGTAFNFLEYPTNTVLLVVLWRLRYKLSLRDVAEMFLERGFVFTHEAVRDWEARCAPLLADQLRTRRRGKAGTSWDVDEPSSQVNGKWCSLSRAIARDGNLLDSLPSREARYGGSQAFLHPGRCSGWARSGASDNGWT